MDNCIQIGSGSLKIWLGEHGKYHTSSRFDWAGFIPQVSLNGHTFCTTELSDWNPFGSGGEGLCDEFRVDERTMGWDENDNYFLKPGVGVLERADDKPYHIMTEYALIKPFTCHMEAGSDFADFHVEAIPFKNIAYTMDKHIGIVDNMLIITTSITNTGTEFLYFREYNHNFLSMDSMGAHPMVTLTMHKNYVNKADTPGLIMNEDNITFTDAIKNNFMIVCHEPEAYSPMRWELRDNKTGMSVQEWGDFPVTGFLAWGGPHVIAPEIYGDFPVSPGRTRAWTRLWKFFI